MMIPFLVFCIGLCCSASVRAENWPQWRGPFFNGSTKETGLPHQWSKTDKVRWRVDLPGPSAATPAVWQDRVFVSALDETTKDLLAICLDRSSGKVLWKHVAGSGFGGDNRSNKASPSPVTDGKMVFFYYGSGDLVAFDLAGNKKWARNIQNDYGKYAFLWTYSSSPLLYEGKLYIPVMQRDVQPRGGEGKDLPSYLLALDPENGKTLWKHLRPSEAKAESREALTTPVPVEHEGRKAIVLAGGDSLTGHDPITGEELWRWGTWNPERIGHWRLVPSPVYGAGVILVAAPKGGSVYAVKAGIKGDLSGQDSAAIAWKTEARVVTTDVCTPLFYQNRFYILDGDKKVMTCVDAKTGQTKWSEELESSSIFRASPTAADGKIYCMNHRGEVFVLEAGDKFKLLQKISMGDADDDQVRSSIAISQGQLFIRTGSKLYCVGNP